MTNGADGPSTRVSRLSFTEVWAPAAEGSKVEAAARRSAARSNLCHCGAKLTFISFLPRPVTPPTACGESSLVSDQQRACRRKAQQGMGRNHNLDVVNWLTVSSCRPPAESRRQESSQ